MGHSVQHRWSRMLRHGRKGAESTATLETLGLWHTPALWKGEEDMRRRAIGVLTSGSILPCSGMQLIGEEKK